MKNIFTLALALATTALFAQKEGIIKYEEKINVHRKMTGEAAKYKEMVPEFSTNNMELWFNEEVAKYASATTFNPDQVVETEQGGMRMMMRMMGANSEHFYDMEKAQAVEQREFMSRIFLIEDKETEQPAWKMSPEQKKILDYTCMKATLQKDSTTIVAWFTPQIPVKVGPRGINQLPGLILEADINDGDLIISATEVKLEKVDKSKLTMPKKGKKVSNEEFEAIVKEKTEEMRQQYGGRGNVHITTR